MVLLFYKCKRNVVLLKLILLHLSKVDLIEAFKISPETIAQYRSRGTQLAADLKDFLDSNSKKIGAKMEAKYSGTTEGQDVDDERED